MIIVVKTPSDDAWLPLEEVVSKMIGWLYPRIGLPNPTIIGLMDSFKKIKGKGEQHRCVQLLVRPSAGTKNSPKSKCGYVIFVVFFKF